MTPSVIFVALMLQCLCHFNWMSFTVEKLCDFSAFLFLRSHQKSLQLFLAFRRWLGESSRHESYNSPGVEFLFNPEIRLSTTCLKLLDSSTLLLQQWLTDFRPRLWTVTPASRQQTCIYFSFFLYWVNTLTKWWAVIIKSKQTADSEGQFVSPRGKWGDTLGIFIEFYKFSNFHPLSPTLWSKKK